MKRFAKTIAAVALAGTAAIATPAAAQVAGGDQSQRSSSVQ